MNLILGYGGLRECTQDGDMLAKLTGRCKSCWPTTLETNVPLSLHRSNLQNVSEELE